MTARVTRAAPVSSTTLDVLRALATFDEPPGGHELGRRAKHGEQSARACMRAAIRRGLVVVVERYKYRLTAAGLALTAPRATSAFVLRQEADELPEGYRGGGQGPASRRARRNASALCSICVTRPARSTSAIEGFTGVVRSRPVCRPCATEVPEPAYYEPVTLADRFDPSITRRGTTATSDTILEIVRSLGGCGSAEVRDFLRVTDSHSREADAIDAALYRLLRRGALVATVDPTRRGRIYSLVARSSP